jgi:hypothetical protein
MDNVLLKLSAAGGTTLTSFVMEVSGEKGRFEGLGAA